MIRALQKYVDWLHLQWPAGDVEKLPRVDDHYRSSVDGVYVVGDLAGVPLLKFSIDSGVKAVRHAAEDLGAAGGGDGAPTGAPDGTREAPVSIAILGAGAAGMAAAREARNLGIDAVVLEANRRFATIKDFQQRKPIYTYPQDMTPAGDLTVSAEVKEALVEELEGQTHDLPVREFEAHRIARDGDVHVIESEDGDRVYARRVIVAIGRSGNFRSLGVPGEDREFVHHRLHDPTKWAGKNVVVIGGGDSALEAATALTEAGAAVTLSYRRDEFTRPKPENVDRTYELATYHAGDGSLRLRMPTDVKSIGDHEVTLSDAEGDPETVRADAVYAMIGREAPLDFFRRSGIRLRNDFGDLPATMKEAVTGVDWLSNVLWRRVGAFAAFFLFMCAVYSWKDGGIMQQWASAAKIFPFNLSGDPDATGLGEIILTSATKPGFYYTLVYSLIVVIFGFRRIRRRQTPYIRVQTLTLMAIQVVPLFLLPEMILPYLGANGLLPTGFLDALFPTSEWAVHGREYWRAYGFILAWPLLVYNVFTAEPLWWWIAICFVQTFVLIPGMIYFWGKGAYCGWICSCGALAETLGDEHRDKMPHGEGWNKLNLVGQALMVLAFALLFFRIGGWVWPGGWMDQAFNQLMFGAVFGLQINYAWLVDVVMAGMIGYGVYFWLSGRFWCRFLCPLAALMHIYARFSRFRILADKEKCISCNVCTSVCHQGIDVMSFAQKGEPMADPQCVRCSACVQSCPTGVLSFGQVEPSTGAFISRDSLEASATRIREGA
jgi:thioredoxin reductase/ferredoxin